MAKNTTSKKSVKTKKTTTKRSEVMTAKINARKEYYSNADIMQINSTCNHAKDSELPNLNKKQLWLYTYLASNVIANDYNYTLTSLSNDYRKSIKESKESKAKKESYKFRKSFLSSEVFSITDIKAIQHYFYHANSRLWEYRRNTKGNYFLHEVKFIPNLSTIRK